ncbi:sensor histidine kinase [Solihabitans fulvus]|uniref:histidine kinase n=1 Tax=Solihabitans fulvus TaxID=1892852 RepID=A0A5B2X8C3_9PSEU|nr:sensor domain-containing protein [Solihabitans fulvus]KAA2259500.1 sensor histidine kinase [Solihabitans fulvus]
MTPLVSRGWVASWRCVRLGCLMIAEAAVGTVVGLALLLLPTGIGFSLLPPAATALRSLSDRSRALATSWSGTEINPPDPLAVDPVTRRRTQVGAILTDEGFWRDLLWSALDPIVGGVLVCLPPTLIVHGAFGVLVQPFLWRQIIEANGGDWWYTFMPVTDTATMLAALALGAGFLVTGVLLAPALLRLHSRWSRVLLAAPRSTELARRVAWLTDTRSDALGTQAAELRRIERDLHDGAQARLVAMGMTLDSATRLFAVDPDAAYRLLVEARETSNRALDDLRNLVRGIHPPVLADRGLGDAVRSLALDCVLDVHIESRLAGRFAPPVESAAYFAVNEVLTNAAKHSGAREVRIVLEHDGGVLRITVTDDGHGGADSSLGTGLRGVRRRLATFDGALRVHSPMGGPTIVTMELMCALSSPKTSSF